MFSALVMGSFVCGREALVSCQLTGTRDSAKGPLESYGWRGEQRVWLSYTGAQVVLLVQLRTHR